MCEHGRDPDVCLACAVEAERNRGLVVAHVGRRFVAKHEGECPHYRGGCGNAVLVGDVIVSVRFEDGTRFYMHANCGEIA